MKRLIGTALLAAMLVAANGTTTPWTPIYTTEATYAHCGSAAKATTTRTTYAMDATAPTVSFTANGGCGTADTDKTGGEGVIFTGTHFGNLDQLTVDAWIIDAGPVRAELFDKIYVNAIVTVDGVDHVYQELQITPAPSSTGLSRLLQFTVTGIGLKSEADYKQHDISVQLETAPYLDGDQIAWVLDASEVPTGVTYSGPKKGLIVPSAA